MSHEPKDSTIVEDGDAPIRAIHELPTELPPETSFVDGVEVTTMSPVIKTRRIDR